MLARIGLMPDPCGVPTSTGSHRPLSRTPALSHRSIKRRIRGSAILCPSAPTRPRTEGNHDRGRCRGAPAAPTSPARCFARVVAPRNTVVRFAQDSLLEGAGFEPSVPLSYSPSRGRLPSPLPFPASPSPKNGITFHDRGLQWLVIGFPRHVFDPLML